MNTCTSCGQQFEPGMFFCDNCGARFGQETPPPPQYQQPPQYQPFAQASASEYNTQTARFVIGKNADYYIQKFSMIEATKNTTSWNWPAFLFTWIWMLYRGMTKNPLTWALLGLDVLTAVLMYTAVGWVFSLGALGLSIYLGCQGNQLYKKHIDEKLANN